MRYTFIFALLLPAAALLTASCNPGRDIADTNYSNATRDRDRVAIQGDAGNFGRNQQPGSLPSARPESRQVQKPMIDQRGASGGEKGAQ